MLCNCKAILEKGHESNCSTHLLKYPWQPRTPFLQQKVQRKLEEDTQRSLLVDPVDPLYTDFFIAGGRPGKLLTGHQRVESEEFNQIQIEMSRLSNLHNAHAIWGISTLDESSEDDTTMKNEIVNLLSFPLDDVSFTSFSSSSVHLLSDDYTSIDGLTDEEEEDKVIENEDEKGILNKEEKVMMNKKVEEMEMMNEKEAMDGKEAELMMNQMNEKEEKQFHEEKEDDETIEQETEEVSVLLSTPTRASTRLRKRPSLGMLFKSSPVKRNRRQHLVQAV